MAPGRRLALLVAASEFDDPKLRSLRSSANDVAQLDGLLRNEAIGGYSVVTSVNEPTHIVRRTVNRFFKQATAEDFLLLYVSTHGLKDERGNLYFATVDTEVEELQASTCEASFIHSLSAACRAKQQLLLFDSCFSGAFGRSWAPKDGQRIHREDIIGEKQAFLERDIARGLVVFTASTSFQYSFEDNITEAADQPSVFTKHVIHGIASGEADLNGDGLIGEGELYQYAFSKTSAEQPGQTPQRWVIGAVGDLTVAQSNRVVPQALPRELSEALSSPYASIRAAAIGHLSDLARSNNKGLARTAFVQLEKHSTDDSIQVREAVSKALAAPKGAPSPQLPPAPPKPIEHINDGAQWPFPHIPPQRTGDSAQGSKARSKPRKPLADPALSNSSPAPQSRKKPIAGVTADPASDKGNWSAIVGGIVFVAVVVLGLWWIVVTMVLKIATPASTSTAAETSLKDEAKGTIAWAHLERSKCQNFSLRSQVIGETT